MKRWYFNWSVICVALIAFMLSSCSDDDGYSLGNFNIEVVTVVPEGNSYYLRRDNGEKLWPFATACPEYRVKLTRAAANYTLLSDSIPGYSHGIKVNWIDDILTKKIAPYKGMENDSIYGTDPVEIKAMQIGDDYLTIRFGANFGNKGIAHMINLIPTTLDNSNYILEFRHNAFDDEAIYGSDGLVAFDLSSLPNTNGKTVELIIRAETFDGKEEYKLAYNSNTASLRSEPMVTDSTGARQFE